MYFSFVDLIERSARNFCRWFFNTFLFCTQELQCEVTRYFETGHTSFRYFEWLNVSRIKTIYPKRWKIVLADFAGAYLKLSLIGIFVVLVCLLALKYLP